MDCRSFDDRLAAMLHGGLEAAEREAMERHAAECPRCGELTALLGLELDSAGSPPPDGLAETILERTSGKSCGRARDLLCDLADGILGEPDAEIVGVHLAHCRECRACADALRRLGEDLPALAEESPDPGIVEGVLARTSRAPRRRVAAWGERFRDAWGRALARPRFAAEGAYVGSLVLTALIVFPAAPMHELPGQALAAARARLAAGAGASDASLRGIKARFAALRSDVRRALEARLPGPIAGARREFGEGRDALRRLGERVSDRVTHLFRGDCRVGNESTTDSSERTKEMTP